jgi:hypothetical protein
MTPYDKNRAWSDRFIPQIKAIVGPRLLVQAPLELDTKYATDLIVFKARDLHIAARVRRPGYQLKYGYEFTIRSRSQCRAETEIDKMIAGFGDWMFYAHANNDDLIVRWMIIDLARWRSALIKFGYSWQSLATEKDNGDGTSFLSFDVRKLSPSVIVASNFEAQEDREYDARKEREALLFEDARSHELDLFTR